MGKFLFSYSPFTHFDWRRAISAECFIPLVLHLIEFNYFLIAVSKGREVVFQCRDEGPIRAKVVWTRASGLPLPAGSSDNNGRLEMPNIQVELK